MATQITTRFIASSAVTAAKIDLTGTFDFSSGAVSVATPSSGSHAASKSYVDNAINGLHWKESVEVATLSNITLSGTQSIGGISVQAGDRVLVRAQTDASENGIYVCAAGAWSRSADMNEASEFPSSAVFVRRGATYSDVAFVCSNDAPVTVGTTDIVFVQFTGAGAFTAGNGLTLSGTTFSIDLDGSSLAVSGSGLKIADGGIAGSMIPDGEIANAKLANSTISGVALGSNLNSLSAGNGLSMTAYNGSAAVSNLTIVTDGGSLAVSASGIKIADGGIAGSMIPDAEIANAKLANSTISGVALGANLNSLSAGNGLSMTSYNGSATVSDLTIDLDGSSLSVGADGIKIADGGVSNSKIAEDSVTTAKLDFAGFYSEFTASSAQTTFDLGAALDLEFKKLFIVTVNGLGMRYADSPSSADQYSIANNGSGGVARITFGSGLESGDLVSIRGFINN